MILTTIRQLLRRFQRQSSEGVVRGNQSSGLGRREFLRLVGGVIVEATFAPLATVITHGDQYINRKLGLAFARPKDWYYESLRDFSDLKKGSVIGYVEDFIDILAEELGEDLPTLDSSNPLAVISKYDDGESFNPCIMIYFSGLDDRNGNAEYLLSTSLEMLNVMYRDFELVEPVSALSISSCPASRAKVKFLYEHFDSDPTLVELETYMIFTQLGQYNVQMIDSVEIGEKATSEFKMFIQSLKIA